MINHYKNITKGIKASELEVGMMLALEGKLEKVININRVEQWIVEDVPIQEIEPGDEVLSLNDRTGKWEWHKVEAALFKGIQDLYELVTSRGKRIRTTREHPYFVQIIGNSNQDLRGSPEYNRHPVLDTGSINITQAKWLKVFQLKVGMAIATIDGWEEISSVRKVKRQRVYDLQIEGTHNFVGGHLVDTRTGKALSQKEEEAIYQLLSGGFFTGEFEHKINQQQGDNNHHANYNTNPSSKISQINHNSSINSSSLTAITTETITKNPINVNTNPLWMVGNKINSPAATLVSSEDTILTIERISNDTGISIERLEELVNQYKAKQIQYGGIVAHNTYLMGGNVGIGWTSPSQLFQINPTYVGTQLTNPLPFTVTSIGNVGIGTTAPRSALDILAGSLLQTPQNPTYIGGASLTSGTGDFPIFISGRYAYVLDGVNLRIYDITNPSSPTQVGTVSTGSNNASAVFVSGRYAYIGRNASTGACSSTTSTGCELEIYDVSNPARPLFVGGADDGGSNTNSVFVSGRYLYLGKDTAAGTCSLSDRSSCEFQVYDVSNPTSPVYVGGADDGGNNSILSIFVSGRYAYILGGFILKIFDVSNPTSPKLIGTTSSAGTTLNSVFVSGRYAYVVKNTAAGNDFVIYDVSNPASPTLVGGADLGATGNSVFVSGRYAYVGKNATAGACDVSTNTGCELMVYDVSNPNNPLYIGGADDGGDNVGAVDRSIFISGRYAYLGKDRNLGTCSSTDNTGCEFQIYDVGGIDVTSALIGSLEAGGLQVRENAFVNNQLYVGGGLDVGPGGLFSNGMVGIGVSSGTTGLMVEMIGARGTGSTAPSAIFNGGNVGIGSTETSTFPTLSSMLYIAGNLGIGWTSTGTSTPDVPGLGLSVFGNVGIGTTSPSFGLQVIGNVGIGASLTVGSALQLQSYNCSGLSNLGKLTADSSGRIVCMADTSGGITGTGGAGQITFWTASDTISGNNAFYWNNGLMRLGIGNSAPGTTLSVFGSVGIGSSYGFAPLPASLNNGLAIQGNVGIGTTSAGGALVIASGLNVGIGTTSPIAPLHIWGNDTTSAIFLNGNIGIGWTSPSQLFQINPTYVGTQLTNPLPFVVTSVGNVGVGTTAPRSALDILAGSLLQTPQNPTYIGGANALATNSVFTSGKYVYTGDINGLKIFDVTNPNAPIQTGSIAVTTTANSVYVSGRYAYIGKAANTGTCSSTTNTGCEFQIYDVSNPNNPLYVGGADARDANLSVFVSGRYAYVGRYVGSDGANILQIYDVSNPTNPVLISVINIVRTSNSVFVSGRYAYVGDNTSGFRIYDVSDPANPKLIALVSTASPVNSIFVSGRYAYTADSLASNQFQIFDVSNPYSSTRVSSVNLGGTGNSVFVSGRYAYIGKNATAGTCNSSTNTGCELMVYDVSNPSSPTFIGGADDGGNNANGVFVSGRYAYLGKDLNGGTCSASDNAGCELQVYDVGGIDVTSAIIGSLEAGGLQVRENAFVNNQLYVGGGLDIGPGGLFSNGMVGIGVSSGTTGLMVEMIGARGTGSTAPSAIFNGGNVGIGSTETSTFPTLSSMLYIAGNLGIGWTNTGTATPAIPGLGLSVFGNVGIGTTTANYALQVVGNTGIGVSLTASSPLQLTGYNCSGLVAGGKLTADSSGRINCADDNSSVSGSGALNQVTFFTDSTTLSGANTLLWNNPLMRLGVGSSAPGARLGVFGSVGIGANYGYATLPASANNGLVVEGNVGIGTSSPTASLYVAGNVGIGWTGANLSSTMPGLGLSVKGFVGIGTTSPTAALHIITNSDPSIRLPDNTTAPTLSNNGDLAIGSISTGVAAGQIWVRSNGATYRFNSVTNVADYSEFIAQDDTSEPGDVMVLAGNTPGVGSDSPGVNEARVKRSSSTYDENIIGVITNRGTSYNNPDGSRAADPTYANVGMLGQVFVKVSLENGAIKVGDPLTSSSIQGQAMKAIKPGRIIGRAMEDYLATPGVGPDSPGVSSTGAPPFQILMQVNVTWWESEQLITKQDNGMLYLDGNLRIGGSPPNTPGVGLSVDGSIFSSSNILSLGNVGIGTTNPLYGLDVVKEASSSATASIVNLSTSDTPDTSGLRIGLGTPVSGVSSNFLDFYAGVGTTPGVGLDSPGVRVGRIRLNDNKVAYESVGADFAEYFDVSEDVEDGDVIGTMDGVNGKATTACPVIPANAGIQLSEHSEDNSPRLLTTSSSELDPRLRGDDNSCQPTLIGVVSHDAAFVGNANYKDPSKTQAIIGLLGQVKTKVSTINGEIKKGDYLTSSSIPGVAQKATKPGQVIGQALEEFTGNLSNTPGVENCAYTPGVECGQIPVLVKPGFADPGNFLSSLSMDSEGNLIIPKLKVSSLQLEETQTNQLITDSSSVIPANAGIQLTTSGSELDPRLRGDDTLLASNTYYDLTGKIATLEERIDKMESVILNASEGSLTNVSSNELRDSSLITQNDTEDASSSALLAELDKSFDYAQDLASLDLTPPDILLATGSATLSDISVTSDALIGGKLTAYQAQIQDNFSVFGQTTLGDTLIAGNFTVDGTLSIENGNEINVAGVACHPEGVSTTEGSLANASSELDPSSTKSPQDSNACGILYLQKSPLAQGIDIFNGKITLGKDGTIKAKTIIVDQIRVNQGKAVGVGVIAAGQKEAIIENALVDPASVILITPSVPLPQTMIVSNSVKGKSFTVRLLEAESQDIKFDYLIISIQPSIPTPISQVPVTILGP